MGLLEYLQSLGNQQYAGKNFDTLYNMRNAAQTPEAQNTLGPYEHRAFVREHVQDNPVKGSIGMAAMIPGYTLAKYAYQATQNPLSSLIPWSLPVALGLNAMGVGKTRSAPSLEEVKQGYIGLGEGLLSPRK